MTKLYFLTSINFRGYDPLLSGEKIYDCDFSAFTQEGTFYIYVPGIGRSYDFEIHPAVYNEAFHTAAKGLFLSRCGMELESAHAGDICPIQLVIKMMYWCMGLFKMQRHMEMKK